MDGAELANVNQHLTVKKGTGTHKKEYVITIKNIPYQYLDGNPISASRHYLRGIILSVYGQNQKSSGRIYIDNVTVKRGKKAVINYNFNDKKHLPRSCSVIKNKKSVKGVGMVEL